MHRDFLNPHHIPLHPPLLIHLPRLQLGQRRQPLLPNDPAENRILPVQMRRRSVRDEELTPVRPRPFIRHRHDPAHVMSQGRTDLVLEIGAPYRGTGFRGGGCGGAGLDDEGWEGAVERGGVVVAGSTEG